MDAFRPFSNDFLGDLLLRAHGVHGDNAPGQFQRSQQWGQRGDLVALALHRPRRQHEPGFMRIGRDDVQSAGAALVLLRAAQRLAVDGDGGQPLRGRRRRQANGMASKRGLQRLGVDALQDQPQPAVGRRIRQFEPEG